MIKLKSEIFTEDILKKIVLAEAHPIRLQILAILIKTNEPRSPKQISEELNQPLGSVAYHIRRLHHMRLIKLDDLKAVRGATEHFYRTSLKKG